MFTPEQTALLEAPLDRKHVASRSQAGRSLSYLEGWHVIAEANRIFGFDAWDRETVELRQLGEPYQTPQVDRDGRPKSFNGEPIMNWRVGYMAKVRVTVRSADDVMGQIVREGCGFGSGIDRDLGQAHESALKEAETDAMKRALMTFGNPFGLALYDKTQANVADAEPAQPASRPAPARPAPVRAIPAAISHSSDAPSDVDRRIADSLISAGQAAVSEDDLDLWKTTHSFKKTFYDLPKSEQDRVVNAMAQHRQSLKERAT